MWTQSTRPATALQAGTSTDRYTKLPDALIAELTSREHKLVHLLLSYKWFRESTIRPYVGTMAERMKCDRRTVQRALRSLEYKGYIIRVARYRDESEDGHHGQTSNEIAPGPMLLPLLPPLESKDAPTDGQDRRTPVTPMSGLKRQGNYPKRERRNERRYTPPACDLCGTPKGSPHRKGECYLR